MEPLVPRASSLVWYWFLLFGCKKRFFPSASIWSEFILTLLLWEGIYICKRRIISENIYKGRKGFFLSHSIWSKSVSNNFSVKKFRQRESDGFSRNDSLQQDWVEIARFHFRGSLFSAFFFFCAIFQLLVLAVFGAGAIFQLLVLAIFGDFLEDSFLQHREGFCQN